MGNFKFYAEEVGDGKLVINKAIIKWLVCQTVEINVEVSFDYNQVEW